MLPNNMYQSMDPESIINAVEFEEIPNKKNQNKVLLLAASMIIIGIVAYSGYSNSSPVSFMKAANFFETEMCSAMTLQASNEYGVFSAPYPYLQNGELLIEPYKDTTIIVQSPESELLSGLYEFRWTIGDNHYAGANVTVVLTTPGIYDVTVEVVSTIGVVCTYTNIAYVKFVKRELRTLTEADRNRVLDATVKLWLYNDTAGKALFGDKFISIQTFVEEHALASNDIMCDEYHEGSGFITHHLAAGIAFEASVRSVDPAVTIHYWDFTIEGEEVLAKGGVPSDSLGMVPFYSDTWFGSVDKDHHIQDSRWAHSPMPKAPNPEFTHNSYGYIRSYWNNNPDPEISRALFSTCGVEPVHKTVPTCASHYAVLNAETLKMVQLLSPSDGHGPMHVQTGGVWGGCTEGYQTLTTKWADLLQTDITDEEMIAGGYDPAKFKNKWGTTAARQNMLDTAVMGEYFHIYRSLWRSHMCSGDKTAGFLECPEECSEDIPFEECSCKVNALKDGRTTRDNVLSCVLNEENLAYFRAVFPDEFFTDLVEFTTQSSVLEGEMVESASTADPIFWFIHPVIERLVQAKRLPGVTNMGGFEFAKWDVVDGSDQEFFEYSYYSFKDGDMPWYNGSYTCAGHKGTDRALPIRLAYTDVYNTNNADLDGDGMINNVEFFLSLNPNDPKLNDYVFDNFKWDHCGPGYYD